MERLPLEIRARIFWPLNIKDKLSCLIVSKAWYNAVKPCLFNDIRIIEGSGTLSKAVDYFDTHRDLANQVMYLKLEECSNIHLYLPEFPHLFPRMKKLVMTLDRVLPSTLGPRKHIQLTTWSHLKEVVTLERINRNDLFMSERILANNCPRLIKLTTSLAFLMPNDVVSERFVSLFRLLKNAPQLSELVLSSLFVYIEDLEILHENTPLLTSLSISYSRFETSANLPETIKKVNLTNLDFHLVIRDTEDIWPILDYVRKKYVGLRSLTLTAESSSHENFLDYPEMEDTEDQLLSIFANNPQLVKYDNSFCPLTSKLLEKLEECGIQLEELKLYVDQSTLADLFGPLIASKQIQSITHLCITPVDEIIWIPQNVNTITETRSLPYVKQFNVSHLTLQTYMNPICISMLTHYANQLPELTSISLINPGFTYIDKAPRILTNRKIKKIEISGLEIQTRNELRKLSMYLNGVFSRCPDLEHFSLNFDVDVLYPSEEREKYSLFLKFGNVHLKTIDIEYGKETKRFELKSKKFNGQYVEDSYRCKFVKVDDAPRDEFLVQLFTPATSSVLLNSIPI